jgi:5'-AMP-activated protein kinase regulatory gamma subunit
MLIDDDDDDADPSTLIFAPRTRTGIMGGSMSDALITVRPEESLYGAALALLQHRIHRLPIMDPVDRTILHIITHRKINNFLVKNLAGAVGLLAMSIEELGIGTFTGVITVGAETPVIGVLDLLARHNISAVPVVDERGVALGVYANSDIVDIARRRTFSDLDRPVSDILLRRSTQRIIHSCHPKDALQQVLQRFSETKVHRLIATDAQGRVLGIVSLSDILKAFLLPLVAATPTAACPSPRPS